MELFSRDNENHPVKCLPDSSQMYPWVSKLLTQSCFGSNTLNNNVLFLPYAGLSYSTGFRHQGVQKWNQLIPPLLMLFVIKAKITNTSGSQTILDN